MLSVHFEPDQNFDVGQFGPVTWSGAERMIANVDQLRGELERATRSPVRVGWYVRLDRQIEAICGSVDAVAQRFREPLARLVRDGDYLGLHTHATVWDAEASGWVLSYDSAVWVQEVRAGITNFRAATGEPLLRNSTSRSFLSKETAALLADSGVLVDLTTEEPEPNGYFRRPRRTPHRMTSPNGATLLVVPGSTGHPHGGSLPRRAGRRVRRGPFRRWYLHPYRPQQAPNEFWAEIARSWRGLARPHVSFSFRSSTAGGTVDLRQRALLEALLGHPIRHSLRFADPLELCDS